MELLGNVKTYEWGKVGAKSKVAELAKLNSGDLFSIEESQPYSELWMGDHVSGPSSVKVSRKLLSEELKEKPNLIGAELERLPYLFKVLSINTALSIQVAISIISRNIDT